MQSLEVAMSQRGAFHCFAYNSPATSLKPWFWDVLGIGWYQFGVTVGKALLSWEGERLKQKKCSKAGYQARPCKSYSSLPHIMRPCLNDIYPLTHTHTHFQNTRQFGVHADIHVSILQDWNQQLVNTKPEKGTKPCFTMITIS